MTFYRLIVSFIEFIIKINMDFLRATTIQGNYPPLRRKNKVKTDQFMKTIGESFLTFFQQSVEFKAQPSLKQSEQAIQQHYKKIHEIIDSVDQHLARRLQNHENQVFTIVKEQIEQMRAQTNKIVQKLNQAIKEKNTDEEIWKLSNELDYFKSQTYQLFKQNKQVRQQMKVLQKKIKEYEIQLENSDRVMQKLKRKNMKAQHRGKAKTQMQMPTYQTQEITRTSFKVQNRVKSIVKALKTEPAEIVPDIGQLSNQSIINIKVDSKAKHVYKGNLITEVEQVDPLHETWTIPSEIVQKELGISSLPPVQFVKVDSIVDLSEKASIRKIDRQAQTEDVTCKPIDKLESVEVKTFSRTDGIKYPSAARLKKQKHIDLIKNGFHVKLYNQKSTTLNTPMEAMAPSSPVGRSTKQTRYMTNAINKNKIEVESWGGRRSGIRSTMK